MRWINCLIRGIMRVGKEGRKERGRCLLLGRKMGHLQGRTKREERVMISLDWYSNGGRHMKGEQKANVSRSTIFRIATRSACEREERGDLKGNCRPRLRNIVCRKIKNRSVRKVGGDWRNCWERLKGMSRRLVSNVSNHVIYCNFLKVKKESMGGCAKRHKS